MGRIKTLPTLLVNKIAAGEVIERPASVVKELLENAIDANATRIDVTVEDGGKRLIQVTDNGSGLDHDDIALAWAPHATSKLTSSQGLFAIGTMGFRGEALASIASVSRARIVSRTADQQAGFEVDAEAGKHSDPKPTAAPLGTTIAIRDLFFNVPARRKFLKATSTEISHITEQLTRIALAHSQVHFTLTHNNRKTLDLPAASDLAERIAALFGNELAKTLIQAHSDERGVKIHALLAPPDMSRTSGKWQYFFLNSRYIRDRFIQHALREAYRGLIESNRFPVAFIHLEMHPETFDVNVHPTKIEVRFRDSNAVHSQVLATLRERFLETDLSSTMRLAHPRSGQPDGQKTDQVRQAVADFLKASPTPQPSLAFTQTSRRTGQTAPSHTPTSDQLRAELDKLFQSDHQRSHANQHSTDTSSPLASQTDQLEQTPQPTLSVLQIHNSYLVAETNEGLIIVDQHALHERILFERLTRSVRQGQVASQQLLVPMPVELSAQQRAILDRARQVLPKVGIELADFGPDAIAVQAFPAMLDKADPAAVVQDIVDRLADMPTDSAAEQILEHVLAGVACKAAVKAGDKLTPAEITHLLADAKLADRPSNCPHGRPTILKMSLAELEKQFKRT